MGVFAGIWPWLMSLRWWQDVLLVYLAGYLLDVLFVSDIFRTDSRIRHELDLDAPTHVPQQTASVAATLALLLTATAWPFILLVMPFSRYKNEE